MTKAAECSPVPPVPEGLFKDVKYFIVGAVPDNTEKLLNKGGAKRELYLTEMVTHAIAEDDTEYNFSEAKELFEIPVVTSQWVMLSITCGCLLPTEGFNPDSHQVFTDVVVCPSQISKEDSHLLWSLITYNGGRCKTRLDDSITHLVIPVAEGPKYEAAMQHREKIKIVTPDWIVDCVQQKEKLSETRYHPHLLMTEEEIEAMIKLDVKKEEEAEKQELDAYGMPISPPVSTATTSANIIFKSESTRTKEALARMVSNRMISQGGKERPAFDPTLLVKNQMDFAPPLDPSPSPPPLPPPPPEPVLPVLPPTRPLLSPRGMASQRGMMSPRGTGSPRGGGSPRGPRSPRARGGASPRGMGRAHFRNITNSAEGRPPRSPRGSVRGRGSRGASKINQMVAGFGHPLQAMFQGPLPPHLQYGPGGIPTPADLAVYYGHDPSETVPGDLCMLGCVFYITDYHKYLDAKDISDWKKVIEQHGGQVDDSYSNRVTHVLCEHQKSDVFQLALRDGKRVVTAHWINDCLLMKKMQPPWLVLHFPSPYGSDRPCKNQIIAVTNFEGEERMRVKHMISVTGAKYTGYLTRSNSVLIAKRPEGIKYTKAREWGIPVVNVQWLNNLLLGDLMALKLPLHIKYEHFHSGDCFSIAEKWRVGHMLEGWKIPIKVSKEAWKRFNPSQFLKPGPLGRGAGPEMGVSPGAMMTKQTDITAASDSLNSGNKRKPDDENDGLLQEKRSKSEEGTTGVLTEQQMNGVDAPVILMTGIPKRIVEKLKMDVQHIGGIVTSSAERCTHLVVRCIPRTMKFFLAFSIAKYVVTPDWITQSAKAGKFLDEADFLLKDEKSESTFNFNLQESLRRARERKLFQDLSFYITPSVKPSKMLLKEILATCGGKVIEHRPSARKLANSKTVQGKPSIVIITCETDLHLCLDLRKRNIAVHNAEFILTGLIRQEIDYNAYRFDY